MEDKTKKSEVKVSEPKKVKKVAIEPNDWEKIVVYLSNTPVAFANAENAAEINKILSRVLWLDVIIGEVKNE